MNLEILDQLFEPILILNRDKSIDYFNNYSSVFFKAPPRVLRDTPNFFELIQCQETEPEKLFSECLKKREPVLSREVTIQLAQLQSVSYVVVMRFIPFGQDDDGKVMLCFNDLSVEHRLYEKYREKMEEIKSTHDQFLQADKLSTIGELTAGISHEISNPLTIANGNVEVLQSILEQANLGKFHQLIAESTVDIMESLDRITAIIANMKCFLHSSEERKEYCKLSDLIENSFQLVRPSFNEVKAKLKLEVKADDLIALVNPLKIEQVLINLTTNALDALIEANIDRPQVKVVVEKDSSGDQLLIKVMDNGPGIPEEIQEKIFEIFFTTKKVGEGTGLGLAISRKIIEAHQGELSLTSEKDKGTTFTISLPGIETSSYIQNDAYLGGLTHDAGVKVLVVDNEAPILNLFQKFLDESSYVFIGSSSAVDALKVIDHIPVDVIITDYHMPIMNGSDFCQKLRKRGFSGPILYLTSEQNLDHYREDQEKYDVKGLILKPFTREGVINTLDSIGERQTLNENTQ